MSGPHSSSCRGSTGAATNSWGPRGCAIRDLKGKTVGVGGRGSGSHLFLASMLAYVGLNSQQDVTWDVHPWAEAMQLLAEGKLDAVVGFAPDTSALHAQPIGQMVVNTSVDRPWSQ